MDIYIGVLANVALVVFGTAAGIVLKNLKSLEKVGEALLKAFGLMVAVMGIQGVDLSKPVYFIICLIIGIGFGELLDIDKRFNNFGDWLQKKFTKGSDENFTKGFIEATLIFCIGSMTFLGAIQSGIEHEHSIYITKGIIDCVTALSLAMSLGISVAFSGVSILIYQGLLVTGAYFLGPLLTTETITMCVSVGSLSLVAIGLNLAGITKIKVANFLPAMFIPMFWQIISGLIA